jgi:type VI secretion system protein ImpH
VATTGRPADPPVERLLFEEGHRFEFFQAVRLLERLYPGRAAVGSEAAPRREVVRFHALLSLAFPPSTVHQVSEPVDDRPAEMVVGFMGLTGPLGVLPRHYTEFLLTRTRAKDGTLRDFLDLYNHRLVSLFYRAWEKYRFPLGYERARRQGRRDDRFSQYLFCLIGMGTGGLQGRLGLPDEALLFYAGLLAQLPRSASAVAGLLSDYFGVPTSVVQFVGEWLPIPVESQTRLGAEGANNALGSSAVAGSRAWDPQARFRLRVGPLAFRRFCDFLPAGSAFRPLATLTRLMVGEPPSFDVQLVLAAPEVPACEATGREDRAARLGWSSWLKSREFVRDADDAVFAHGRASA